LIEYSISPDKEKYLLPNDDRTKEEISKIVKLCDKERNNGKIIVAVQGLGFVGAIMAAVVADCEINGEHPYIVIGVDLPSEISYWKIGKINSGKSPFIVEDPEVKKIFNRTVIEKKNLIATWIMEVYSEADIIVIDINLDVIKEKNDLGQKIEVDLTSFKNAILDVGKRIKPKSLLIIETTVPPGTIQNIVEPIILNCFKERGIDPIKNPPLIAHSYERIMPGKHYINSVKEMWRSYSALNKEALTKTKEFLSSIIDTKNFPLSELNSTNASELGKVLENSYRAMNIAFINDWTLLAEDIGVNLFEVVNSIKVRKGTHDNMMFPGFGVGGYCLPKDPLFVEWASKTFFNRKQEFNLLRQSVIINDLMPHHTFELLKKGIGGNLKDKKIAILGASYRKDVDDTRNSPTLILYNDIKDAGGIPTVHDPYAELFQDHSEIIIEKNIEKTLHQASAVVFVVNHEQYENLKLDLLTSFLEKNACIIDAFNILSDEKIVYLKRNNFIVLGVGKGHIKDL
jgi:nucleotide sugar dehydrogenase